MALRVLGGPGCDAVGKNDYLDDVLEDGDVVISAGRIFEALTGSAGVPSDNPAALRMALGLRTTAIRFAREKELNGFVLTSNGNRADLDRLQAIAGADEVRVLAYTEAQACARIRAIVPAGERRAACELGVRSRWFARYQASATDRQIRPGGVEDREVLLMGECETVRRAVEIEIREADGVERLVGTILQEGRAASERLEIFAPGALVWGETGIAIRTEHRGAEVARAIPVRDPRLAKSESARLRRQKSARRLRAGSGGYRLSFKRWQRHARSATSEKSSGHLSARRRWSAVLSTCKRAPKFASVRDGGIADHGNDQRGRIARGIGR